VHIVDPALLARPAGDPGLRFVAYMCLCCGEVLRGHLPGPYTDALGEAWARSAIVGEPRNPDSITAARDSASKGSGCNAGLSRDGGPPE
jgi:hypothetical protein